MSATCMTWPGRRSVGQVCGEPATARRGVRCLNGCYGEGEFEYACADHAKYVGEYASGLCAKCRAEVELFPLQVVLT